MSVRVCLDPLICETSLVSAWVRLSELIACVGTGMNVYRHSWSEGDVVLIDQRCTMHYVMPDYNSNEQTRVMQRTTLTDAGDAP